jgi:hypothetical protein
MSAAASMSGGGAVTLSGGTVKRSATGPLGAVAGPLPVVTGQPWAAAGTGGGGRRAMSPRRGDISRRLAAASPTFPTARRRSPSITRSVSTIKIFVSVADPDLGSGAFLTPGFGIRHG